MLQTRRVKLCVTLLLLAIRRHLHGAACGFFASVYTLYRFVKRPALLRAVLCGIAVGLAL